MGAFVPLSSRARRISIACVVLTAGLSARSVAETFPLYVHSYCAPGTYCNAAYDCGSGNVCPVTTWDRYRELVLGAVQELNVEWQATGISFQPKVRPIDYTSPIYTQTTGCEDDSTENPWRCGDLQTDCLTDETCDGIGDGKCRPLAVCNDLTTPCATDGDCPDWPADDCKLLNEQRREKWRDEVAALFPHALHVMVTAGPHRCCSAIPNHRWPAPRCDGHPQGEPSEFIGMYCDASRGEYELGTLWSHEMGHHFCLLHTFTDQDTAENGATPEWNFDANCDVGDTPADPGEVERFEDDGEPGEDLNAAGTGIDGHQWCQTTTVPGIVDPGSPRPTRCNIDCVDFDDGTIGPLALPEDPLSRATMSYYPATCRGPHVIDGQRFEGLSPQSVAVIGECLENVPARQNLIDVCATSGDEDRDGICDKDDNCPQVRNTAQRDRDGDGVGDACDSCPELPFPSADLDQDGIGDLCDTDVDGDGCFNYADQHPLQASFAVGSFYHPGCGTGVETVFAFEGNDTDGDGFEDCRDPDDDNDGICDEGGPLGAGTPGTPGQAGCAVGPQGIDVCRLEAGDACWLKPLPGACKPGWVVCQGGGCLNLKLVLVQPGDPDPEIASFGKFQILNRTLFVAATPQQTLSQVATALQGVTAKSAVGGGSTLRLEIRRHDDDAFVASVGEFDVASVTLGAITHGAWMSVTPAIDPRGETTLDVGAVFGAGLIPDLPVLADPDSDGWPDPFDNCTETANPGQVDADGDGFGNACDADLDNDLLVSQADLDAVQACEGADLALPFPIDEPESIGGIPSRLPPSPAAVALYLGCGPADLDEDLDVDADDVLLVLRRFGLPPGPSAFAIPVDLCEPERDCHDRDPCTIDRCVPATGDCVHEAIVCDDADDCTIDFCDGATGACAAVPDDCDDGNPCTRDACDAFGGGCVQLPLADGTPCDDADACTGSGACLGGVCVAAVVVTCDDGVSCTADVCDPRTGQCTAPPLACDDDPCAVGTCDPTSGGCVYEPSAPPSADALRFVGPTRLEWNDVTDPGHWNTYRGTIPPGGFGTSGVPNDHICFEVGDFAADGPSRTTDYSRPPAGGGWYYLVTRAGVCAEPPPGFDSQGRPRPLPAPCDAGVPPIRATPVDPA